MKKKIGIVLVLLISFLIATNPSVQDLKDHVGGLNDKDVIRKKNNFLVCSIYEHAYLKYTNEKIKRNRYREYYVFWPYTNKYIGIGKNFILISHKKSGEEQYILVKED